MKTSEVSLIFVWLVLLAFTMSPPPAFPANQMIVIAEDQSLRAVSGLLAEERVVRYPWLFSRLVTLTGDERGVLAGEYWFEKPLTVWEVAERVTGARFSLAPVKITVPEGVSVREMSAIFAARLAHFDAAAFVALASPLEGYLFPDTYFFPAGARPGEVVASMSANWRRRTKDLKERILASGRSLGEIMTMASLLEEEAYDPSDRRTIAGILWKRLDTGMPLQVDAVFPYLIGKNSYELSRDDLAFDSPYNTYRYRGLPPGPISNPGLDAMDAALAPTSSAYWFYLSDRRGRTYYAEDFEAHKVNKERYLN